MTEREALKLTLAALKQIDEAMPFPVAKLAIMKAEEALAQPEQEPVAWRNAALRIGEDLSSVGPDGYYNMTAQQWLDWAMEQKPRGNNSLAQPEKEPVACPMCKEWEAVCDQHLRHIKKIKKQRTWVGLTFEEICECESETESNFIFAQNVEAKLKEKNT